MSFELGAGERSFEFWVLSFELGAGDIEIATAIEIERRSESQFPSVIIQPLFTQA